MNNGISDTENVPFLLCISLYDTQPCNEHFKHLSDFTYLSPFMNKMTQTITLPRVSTALMHFLRIVNPILSNCAPERNSDKT